MAEKLPSLEEIQEKESKIKIEKALALEQAFQSSDIDQIYKAQTYVKGIQSRENSNVKSILIDPYDLHSSFGYKDKPYNISFDVLRAMGRVHVIKSIVETRKEQVAAFCTPQKDKYSQGFIIQRREVLPSQKPKKLTRAEEKRVEELTLFILHCGAEESIWHADTFDTFTRKFIQDSLVLDQGTFEVVRTRGDVLHEYVATDGATFRIADSYDDDDYKKSEVLKNGYAPSYVQIIDGKPIQEFYPWELGFCVRNPSTDIHTNGYGKSELEDMIQIITSLLNADTYNSNFFKVGASPKGILRYSGNINENTIQDFRRQWMAQVSGVMNAHKVPIINADKIDFIPTHIPNKDMEFSKFQEFLIKIACALYKIDPSEIGFPMAGASETNAFGGSTGNVEKLKYSRDKGLKPLLKQYQYWLNKYIIWQLDPKFELVFVGIDNEVTYEQELDNHIKELGNFRTLNEIRAERNLPPIEGGDIVLNPIAFQASMAQQAQQQGQDDEYADNPFVQKEDDENPFMKSLQEDLDKLLK